MENTKIGGKTLTLRGRSFVGVVKSTKMMDTITVEWERRRYVPKYQRYEKRRYSIKAHSPKELHVKEGDTVRVQECRPLSKTKNFVVVDVIKNEE